MRTGRSFSNRREILTPSIGFLFGFLIGFSIEVRVHANEAVQLRNITQVELSEGLRAVMQEPAKCLTTDESARCYFQVGARRKLDRKLSGDLIGFEWTLASDALVLRERGWSSLRLIDGTVRMRFKPTERRSKHGLEDSEVRLDGGFATVLLRQSNGAQSGDGSLEVYVVKTRENLKIINSGSNPVQMSRMGHSASIESLCAGCEVDVSKPDVKTGDSLATIPVPLDLEAQVIRESRFHEGSKENFLARIDELAALRRSAAQETAEIHASVANRKIASVAKRDQELQSAREKREARDLELRKMFRKKVLDVQ